MDPLRSLPDVRTGVEAISEADCLRLLATHHPAVGRLALVKEGQPLIFPVNYVMVAESVVFRTDDGTKLEAAELGATVAFEIDHVESASRTGWSVVMAGHVEVARSATQIMLLRSHGLETFAGGDKEHWIFVHPDSITGRRVPTVSRWFW